jgi:hypothetical protein
MIYLVIHVPEARGTLPVIGVSYFIDTSKTKIYPVTPCMSGCQRLSDSNFSFVFTFRIALSWLSGSLLCSKHEQILGYGGGSFKLGGPIRGSLLFQQLFIASSM